MAIDRKTPGQSGRETKGFAVPEGTVARVTGVTWSAKSGDMTNSWFGPGQSLSPIAPPQVAGRRFDYPTFYNTTLSPRAYEGISFNQLRGLADSYDLLRLVIETRKDQIESYSWDIRAKKGKKVAEATLQAAKEFFESPDKEQMWNTWLRQLLEEIFVIDTVCIYPRMTKGGQLYSFELMDGATVKRLLDDTGRTPIPPEAAYQQVLKGLPAVDYTKEELVYMMRNPRVSRVYGLSPVEQIIMTVNIALRRQVHQLNFYTEGNIPEAICGLPESWTTDQIEQFQLYWDTLLEGNLAQRRHMKFVPFDPNKIKFTQEQALKDMYDEWLARVVCFAFSISPTMLVKETNRATADTVQETAMQEGTVPLLNFLKKFFDYLLTFYLKLPDVEFEWDLAKDLDPLKQAQVDQVYISAKVMLPEEVRERNGLPPLTPEQQEKLNPTPPVAPVGKIDPLTGLPYKDPVPPQHPVVPPPEDKPKDKPKGKGKGKLPPEGEVE